MVNLRGNQRTQGERSRQEGGKIFGSGSRASVAITILVRNSGKRGESCRILYHDIGNYLKREEKLAILRDAESVAGIAEANPKTGWREIEPDEHHDWIGQRDAAFQSLYPIGTKEVKAGKGNDAVFRLYSSGYKTSRDAYTYNFSRTSCATNARAMVDDYMGAIILRERAPDLSVDDVAGQYSSNVRWDRELKNNLRRGKKTSYSEYRIRTTQYRPFIRSNCYVDYVLVNNKYQQDRLFPLGILLDSGTDIAERERERERLSPVQRISRFAFPASARPNRSRPSSWTRCRTWNSSRRGSASPAIVTPGQPSHLRPGHRVHEGILDPCRRPNARPTLPRVRTVLPKVGLPSSKGVSLTNPASSPKRRSVSTTSRTRLYDGSGPSTTTAPLPRTPSLTTCTASCIHRTTATALPTIS